MRILAFQSGLHDASAAVFEDYRLIAAVSEERLRREKGWGDDVPEGKLTSFTLAVKREPHETIVFSWITWPTPRTS